MNDLISRQAAIDAINHICPVDTEYDCTLLDRVDVRCVLSDLPSAQPTQTNASNVLNALDCISRQAAIDELMKRDKALRNINWYDKPFAEGECKGIDDALEIINALPSVQPERKKGKWINRSLNIVYPEWERYKCSACGGFSHSYEFCPHCGADMRGEENGSID